MSEHKNILDKKVKPGIQYQKILVKMKRQRKCSVELYFPTERGSHRLEAGSGSDKDSNFTLELHSGRDTVRNDVCARYAYRVLVR